MLFLCQLLLNFQGTQVISQLRSLSYQYVNSPLFLISLPIYKYFLQYINQTNYSINTQDFTLRSLEQWRYNIPQ